MEWNNELTLPSDVYRENKNMAFVVRPYFNISPRNVTIIRQSGVLWRIAQSYKRTFIQLTPALMFFMGPGETFHRSKMLL